MKKQQLKAGKRLATALMVGTALTTTAIVTNASAAEDTSNNERQEAQQQTLTIMLKMPDGNVNQLQFAGAPGSTVQTRKQLESLFGHNPGGKYLLADGGEYQRLPTAVLIPQNGGQIEWQLVNRNLSQKIENRPVKLVIEHRDEDGNKVLEDQVIDFTIDVKYDLDLWKNHALDTEFTVHGPQDIEPTQVPGYLLLGPQRLFTDPTSLIQDETDRNKFFIFNQEPLVMKKTALYRLIDSSKDQPDQPGSDNDDKQDEKPTTPPETDQPTGGQDEKPQTPDEGNKDDSAGSSEKPTAPDSGDEEPGESGKEEPPTTPEHPDDKEDDAQQQPDKKPDDEGGNDNPDDIPGSGQEQPAPEEPTDQPDDEGGQPEPSVPDESQNEPGHQPEDPEPSGKPAQPGKPVPGDQPAEKPAERPDAGHKTEDDLNNPDQSEDQVDKGQPRNDESGKDQGGQNNGEQSAKKSTQDQPDTLKNETDKLTQLDQQSVPGSADDKLPQTGNNNRRSFWAAVGGLLTGFLGLGTALLTKRQD